MCLYTGKVDLRKGINGLCGIISEEMGHNPRKPKSVYIFSGTNPRVKKVLIREYNSVSSNFASADFRKLLVEYLLITNRYELTTIRLDDGRFIRPLADVNRLGGKISWSDFVMLTECAATVSTAVKHID